MPLAARIAVIAAIGALCASAAWLMIARGNAMLIDLSAAAARLFCL